MNARVDHIIDEALALAPEERSAVVLTLLDSLDGGNDVSVGKAWADEIHARKAELQSGAVNALPWAEVRARLQAL